MMGNRWAKGASVLKGRHVSTYLHREGRYVQSLYQSRDCQMWVHLHRTSKALWIMAY